MKNWTLPNLAGSVRNMSNAQILQLMQKCERRGVLKGIALGYGTCAMLVVGAALVLHWTGMLR